MRIGRLLVDVKWGEKNKLLKTFVRRHQHGGTILWAAQGIGIGASSKPFQDYRHEKGAEIGLAWRIAPPIAGDRWVTIDTNWWKTLAAGRLISPIHTPGGWDLFGSDPREHALLADHWTSEDPVETTARGRTVFEWKHKPGRPDNHWWDCLVGSAVAASMMVAAPAGMQPLFRAPRRSGPRVSYIPS